MSEEGKDVERVVKESRDRLIKKGLEGGLTGDEKLKLGVYEALLRRIERRKKEDK